MGIGGFAGNNNTLGKESTGVFLGLWKKIQNGKGEYAFEFQSGNSVLGYLFGGLGFAVGEQVKIHLGYGLANNRLLYKDMFLMRMGLYF